MFDEDPMLAAFARDLQDAAAAMPPPAIGAPLAAILEGRAPATAYPEVVAIPRDRLVRRPARLRWAVAAAAFTLGAGSLGVAGALPGPVQRQVSRMADVIGVDVPDGRDDAPVTPITPAPIPTPRASATATSTKPPVGTRVLGGEQDADELETSEEPERDDGEDTRGRGRPGEEDDRDEDDRDEDDDAPADDQDRVGHDTEDTDDLDDLDDLDSSGRGSVDQDDDPTRDRSGPRSGADVVDGSDGDDDDVKSSK